MNIEQYRTMIISKPSKYKAIKTEVDGFTFDSKLEASYYRVLKAQKSDGYISYFLRQVPIHLPGNYKMVLDFLVVYPNGVISYQEVKGMNPTRDWINKKKAVEAHYPITIEVLKTKDVTSLLKFWS